MNIFKKKYLKMHSIIRVFGSKILRYIEHANLNAEWSIKNANNKTYPVKYFPISLVSIGDHSYGPIDIYTYSAKGEHLEIGKYCSIAKDVKFVLGGNHRTDCLMTYPIQNKFISDQINESLTKGEIVLDDDVWVGVGATILSGVHLGQGCVVAAGSVVTKSFPAYALIGGNPAKIIKMRFKENILKTLNETNINLGAIEPKIIVDNIDWFCSELNENTIRDLSIYLQK